MKYFFPGIFILFILSCSRTEQEPVYVSSYGDLLDSVQVNEIFSDQKKFVDCSPLYSPEKIVRDYHKSRGNDSFNLKDFVGANFDTNFVTPSGEIPDQDILEHIDYLWSYLSRNPDSGKERSTLIPLDHPYIVPGGRFREIYYWDSYFTMLGLAEAKRFELMKNILDNFSDLLNGYGLIPNGNRTYYLSRSQPPYFSLMVELYAESTRDSTVYGEYYEELRKEYQFWNRGKDHVQDEFTGKERIVMLRRGEFLNRYWDQLCIPRPESYLHDVMTMQQSGRDSTLYRDLRAAAESGWDFSSRWLEDGNTLATIHTTEIIPVDLNALLYHLELVLSRGCTVDSVQYFLDAASRRKALILKYFWDNEKDYFFDFDMNDIKQSEVYSLAGLYPLFLHIADSSQAESVLKVIREKFLMDGGLVTTLRNTGQQWDYPNGWPPLQWIGYEACKNYGQDELSEDIAHRWIGLNEKVFYETGKMMEKYDVADTTRPGGGGEYETQDGFGWTNGVFLKMWNELQGN